MELVIDYAVCHSYLLYGLSKDRRVVIKRASTIVVDKGDVFYENEGAQGDIVTTVEELQQILVSDPTSRKGAKNKEKVPSNFSGDECLSK